MNLNEKEIYIFNVSYFDKCPKWLFKVEKIYDYDGNIGITILEGYVKVEERETYYGDEIIDDKQKIIKVW